MKTILSRLALALALLCVDFAHSASDPDKPEETKKEASAENFGHSVAPVVGYDPTFGVVVGGAYFYSQPRLNLHADANTNFQRVYQLHASYRHQSGEYIEHG